LKLPDGWEYRVVVPTEDLEVDLTAGPVPHVKDDFNQVYARILN
jgi:hypothetical protein